MRPRGTGGRSRPRRPGGDLEDRLERARAYLARIPGAISGQRGHDQTFAAALHLLEFGLSQAECLDLLLREYNPRCVPPWSERELRHKVESVYQSRLAGSLWGKKLERSSPPPSRGRSLGWPSSRPHPGPDPDWVTLPPGVPVFVVAEDSTRTAIDREAGGRAVAVTRSQCRKDAIGLALAPLVLVCDGGRLPSAFARHVTLPSTGIAEWLQEQLDEAELARLAPWIDSAVDPTEWRGLWSFVALLEEKKGWTPAEATQRATARTLACYGRAEAEFGDLFPDPPLSVPRSVPWPWAADGHPPVEGDTRIDAAAIESFLRAIVAPGEWFELRCLGCGASDATFVGAYSSHTIPMAIADLMAIDADSTSRPRGVYVTMNPILPLPRPVRLTKARSATRDDGIARRRWVVLDFDPVRPSGGAANKEELGRAERAAAIVAEELAVLGAPWPTLRAQSGNGYHLWYRVDLPNDADSTKLVRRVLERAASLNPFANVEVDQRLTNASRIIRLAGMINRKGTATAERPWRMASLCG